MTPPLDVVALRAQVESDLGDTSEEVARDMLRSHVSSIVLLALLDRLATVELERELLMTATKLHIGDDQ